MAALLSGGFGALLRAFSGLSCGQQPLRCSSVNPFCSAVRWFTNSTSSDNRPKRPLTAYLRYVVEQQPLFKTQYPGMPLLDLTKYIALSWRKLPDSERLPYETAAHQARKAYKEELNVYNAQLSGAQIGAMREARRQRKAKRKKMRQKRELTVLGKPKRPRSSFNIFMAEHFQDAAGDFVTAKLKSLCDDWSMLPESQKQPYVQLAEDDRIRYENEMKSWEEQMIEVGREDLVRYKSRIKLRKPRKTRTVTDASKTTATSKPQSSSTSSSPEIDRKSGTTTIEE